MRDTMAKTSKNTDTVTVPEVAEALGMKKAGVLSLIRQGRLVHVRDDGSIERPERVFGPGSPYAIKQPFMILPRQSGWRSR